MNQCDNLDKLRKALGQDIPDDDVIAAAVNYIVSLKQRAKEIVKNTTGWVIVHPNGWVEMDYFAHGLDTTKYRPGCVRVHVRLVVEE